MNFDLDTYLQRIALPARPTRDHYGLQALQRAHRLAIPFENLAIPLGDGVAIDSGSVFTKLVAGRRGGYCFEQNRLFRDALGALGFGARPLLARVWMGGDGSVPPLTHTLSLVTIDGQDWIADAGFGGSYAPPMRLVADEEVAAPDGARFRLTDAGAHGWMLWRDGAAGTGDGRSGGQGWEHQYSFTLAPVFDADLTLANHWTATAPGTRFTTLTLASIVLPTGFASLNGRHYRRYTATDSNEAEITDPRVYRLRLSLVFGIDLTDEQVATLWERL